HLDSWDLGTGTTDNGTGSMATLEAARIIAQSGLKPRRTIRFILFTGEEQGLLGSRKYAEAHAPEADSIQAVIVLDNGAGAITGGLAQASMVIAVSAFELANLPAMLTRWEKRLPVQPIVAAPVSPDLLRGH